MKWPHLAPHFRTSLADALATISPPLTREAGTGAHHCLGANLAKMEIGLIFNAIADAMPDIRQAGDAERLRSGWLNGIKHLRQLYLIPALTSVSLT